MASISLISVNIERSKHLDAVSDFLAAHDADVICMQELCERDVAYFESSLAMRCLYAPAGLHPADPPEEGGMIVGLGIFSRLPIVEQMVEYYAGSEEGARADHIHSRFIDHALVMCDLEKDGAVFRIATTHFAWTPKGEADDAQRQDMQAMLEILDSSGEFVLCGDFNAPRGGEIFSRLAEKYTDSIPAHYATSLDPAYHRAPIDEQADKMVDGLFTTPAYAASDVALHAGISDHCAITATIAKA
jgi:endonuclease/exonuclease/phosphatase family metal-dependent hydrolase